MRKRFERGREWGTRLGVIGALVCVALVAAPAALANTTSSTNWAGYAVHRTGGSFRQVSGSWTQPAAVCVAGRPTYSSAWVGLGGYSPASDALEQIGTELDCSAAGRVVSSAWYELVPAPSRTISLSVAPGDAMHASVTVTGHRVVVELDDLTTHHGFRKTLRSDAIDVSSAEWIVEAPSQCISQFTCQALPLANFGSVSFTSALAAANDGAAGTIASSAWTRTRIKLTPGSQALIVSRNSSDSAGVAAPSALRGGGGSFDITYATAPPQARRASVVRAPSLSAGYIRH